MDIIFEKSTLESIYLTGKEKGKPKYGHALVKAFIKTVFALRRFDNLKELTHHRGLLFEKLYDNYAGFYSVRVNDQYRLILSFKETVDNKTIITITEIIVNDLTDYH
jgi:proteic killer suppression protein